MRKCNSKWALWKRYQYPVNLLFAQRKVQQQEILKLPLFPTTTIGSFPQTKEVRSWRAQFKKGEISAERYTDLLKEETKSTIQRQEKLVSMYWCMESLKEMTWWSILENN